MSSKFLYQETQYQHTDTSTGKLQITLIKKNWLK